MLELFLSNMLVLDLLFVYCRYNIFYVHYEGVCNDYCELVQLVYYQKKRLRYGLLRKKRSGRFFSYLLSHHLKKKTTLRNWICICKCLLLWWLSSE